MSVITMNTAEDWLSNRTCRDRTFFLGPRPVDNEVFAFGSFRLNPAERLLLDDGKPLRLGSRALEILITLYS